jgi:hypothetical protein
MPVTEDRLKRVAIVAGSLGVTTLAAAAALMLGHWGFGQRQQGMHASRLERLLKVAPTREQVDVGLREEGALFLGSARTAEDQERMRARWRREGDPAPPGDHGWAEARAYRAGSFVYLLYFDGAGILRGFSLVSDPGS